MSLAPAITVLLVTGGEDVIPALSASIAGNRRDDVEWLVVDNALAPVAHPLELAGMPVRWLNSPPGDGHLAFARGAAAALGSFVFPILPGDRIEPDSLSLILRDWQAIPAARRARLSGMTGLIETGAPSGVRAAMSPFPAIEAEPADLRHRYGWTGQPAFTIRVELARAMVLPNPGGLLPPLDPIWISVSRGWKTHTVNERLISRNGPAVLSPEGRRYDAQEALSFDLPRLIRSPSTLLETARTYHRTGRDLKKSLRAQFRDLSGSYARTAWLITLPLSRAKAEKTEESPPVPVTTLPFSASTLSSRPTRGRLVLLARSLDVPGGERELVTLATGLHRRHIDVRVVVFYRGPLERELIDAGVPLTILEKRGRWDLFRLSVPTRPDAQAAASNGDPELRRLTFRLRSVVSTVPPRQGRLAARTCSRRLQAPPIPQSNHSTHRAIAREAGLTLYCRQSNCQATRHRPWISRRTHRRHSKRCQSQSLQARRQRPRHHPQCLADSGCIAVDRRGRAARLQP